MTPLERQVWAAAFGARYAASNDTANEALRVGDAFECATYAVEALREKKRRGEDGLVFVVDDTEEDRIEADVTEGVTR